MQTDMFFYAAFLGQIIVLSFYLPRKALDRVKYVFETYPPSEFPSLYPGPIENYERARRTYKRMNTFILLAGLVLLAVLLGMSRSGKWDSAIATWFFMLQVSPIILVEIWAVRYYRLMREADARTTRTAELQPRRLFDFVSPVLVGVATSVYVAFCGLIVYVKQFDFPWFGGYLNIVIITAANLFFAGIIIWKLRGKKTDPHQAYEDRLSQIGLVVNQLVLVSVAATVFAAITITLASLDLRYLQPSISCLYLQILAVICFRKLRIDNMNFDVYRGDPSKQTSYSVSEDVARSISYRNAGIGLGLGMLLGAAVGAELGETLFSLISGAGVGAVLGIAVGSRLVKRKESSPDNGSLAT